MKKIFIATALALAMFGCSSSDDGGNGGNTDAAALSAPANNSECTTGTEVSSTESKVTFQWAEAPETETYFLYIKNLETGGQFLQHNAGAATSHELTLLKGKPYAWYVSAKKTGGNTETSATWKFYNAGDAITNYAPFPAEVVFPAMSETVSGPAITLAWEGGDVDGDIDTYMVYMDTDNASTLKGTVSAPSMPNVAVVSGQTYYWKVVSIDEGGNESTSPTFQFKVY